jgi:hypothetical protein
MAVSFGQLKTQILFDTNRDPVVYGDAVGNAITTAIKFAESSYFYLFTKIGVVTISDGSNFTALPSDFNQLINVNYSLSNTIYGRNQGFLGIGWNDLQSLFTNTATTGLPRYYALFNNYLYVYPYVSGDTDFTITYYYKDISYPSSNTDTSIWFNDATVDLIRLIAMQRFYKDTLQSPEIAASYEGDVIKFEENLMRKNNYRQINNLLSV